MQPSPEVPSALPERTLVLLVGAVQFVNILDFMMVMPLGPDFAAALGIPLSRLGLLGGSYTLAAAVAGLASARLLDRFDRRSALLVCVLGLAGGTLAGALAWDLYSLLAARIVAGSFGGPATAIALAILVDQVPEQRRGRAMGAVMGAFSLASVLGVPASLELARLGGWQAPFVAVGLVGALVGWSAWRRFPPLPGYREPRADAPAGAAQRPPAAVATALSLTAVSLSAAFLLIPNISGYLQFNLGVGRGEIGTLYLIGGACSYFGMRATGRLHDRYGALPVSVVATAIMLASVWIGFVPVPPWLPVTLVFVALMLAMTARNVNLQSVVSKVPGPAQRAGFMAVNGAVTNLAIALGSTAATAILEVRDDGALAGMPTLVAIMTLLALLQPLLIWRLVRMLRGR